MRASRPVLLYSISIVVFALISLVSIAIARVATVAGTPAEPLASTLGQLLGVHRVLLQAFVVLPIATALVGYGLLPAGRTIALPRLAIGAWALHVLGGLLVLRAVLSHGVEPGWSFAVASLLTRDAVSGAFLAGLACGAVSWLLTAIVLLTTLERAADEPGLLGWTTTWASWLIVGATPVMLAAIALAFVDLRLGWNLFVVESGGDAFFVARLAALTTTPLQTAVLLQLIGAACALVDAERSLSIVAARTLRWSIGAAAAASVFAIDLRGSWMVVSASHAGVGLLFKAVVTACLVVAIALVTRPMAIAMRTRGLVALHVGGALLLLFLFSGLDFFLATPAAAVFTRGSLEQLAHYLMATAAVVAAVGGWHHLQAADAASTSVARLSTFFATILAAGLVLLLLPLALLALAGPVLDAADAPAGVVPLRTVSLFGGLLFAVGLVLTVGDALWRASHRLPGHAAPPAVR